MISSQILKHEANRGKERDIAALLPHWRHALHGFVRTFQRKTQQGEKIDRLGVTKPSDLAFTTALSSRQIKACYNQAHGAYASYLAILEDEIRSKITHSSLSETRKTTLYRLNKQRLWFSKVPLLAWLPDPKTGELLVPKPKDYKQNGASLVYIPATDEDLKLLRSIAKHARTSVPNLRKVRTMNLNLLTAEVQEAREAKGFTHWLRVSTLQKGAPALVPMVLNHHFQSEIAQAKPRGRKGAKGLSAYLQDMVKVTVSPSGSVSFAFTYEKHDAEMRPKDGAAVFVDANVASNLFSTADGRLLGVQFVRWLAAMDTRLMALQAELQRQDRKLKNDPRYRRLRHQIREHTKNEIGRIINRLVADEDASYLVFERLDLRGGGLSPRMNRLVSSMGRKALKAKLARIKETHGVRTEEMNPAYTSQQCSSCGYVAKRNRQGAHFQCRCCGKKLHADINSPRNLEGRRSDPGKDPFAHVRVSVVCARLARQHKAACRGGCAKRSRTQADLGPF